MKFRQALLGRSAFAAILVAGLAASTVAAYAETIIVQGNHRVDAETIKSYFAGGDTNEAVKKLYETGNFSDVKITRSGGTLVVHVVENTQQINHVAFVGNSKVKAEDLEKEVRLKSGGAFNDAAAQADVRRIEDVYRRAGRAAAKVSYRIVAVPNGTIDVVYDINEGDKTGIKEIRFVGNQAFSSSKLVGMMETTEMNYLSWLKSSDVYDPDRIAKDAEIIRRYYLRNGYADFHIIGVDATYDPAAGGYVVTITVEEGLPYTVGAVTVDSHLRGVDNGSLEPYLRIHTGDTYNGDLVDKTVESMTREVGKLGYAFTSIHPRGDRDQATHTVSLAFVAEDGPRVYVERINIRGNTATRDYVIRREFDIGEGDAYNKTLIDKAEKRLNSLGFFKKVKISNEQGSSPDRVIIDVDLEEQSTGSFSVSGGYSTTEGFLAEVSVSQSNFLGRGEYIRTSVSVGQYAKGVEVNYTEPFFLDQRLAAGIDAYSKISEATEWQYYNNWVSGGTLRLGIPLTDEITFAPRYTGYYSLLTIPNTSSQPYNDCGNKTLYNAGNGFVAGSAASNTQYSCLSNGEASLALKQAQGGWVTSMVGFTLSYNSLDNLKDPHQGFSGNIKFDAAGAGGDSKFIRTTGDLRYYHELYFDNVVGIARVQGGNITAFGGQDLRIVDNFNLGNSLVRGFAPGGIGPRDTTNSNYFSDAGNGLGGTNYYGGSLEVQSPIWGIPKDLGLKLAVFADAGTLEGYKGATNFSQYLGYAASTPCTPSVVGTVNGVKQPVTQSNCITVGGDGGMIRSSVGVGLIWASPMGPIRFNYAFATSKSSADVLQQFSFSGGAQF